jgi:hypothetical protein
MLSLTELRRIRPAFVTPCYGGIATTNFIRSLLALQNALWQNSIGAIIHIRAGDSLVTRARNEATTEFLAECFSDTGTMYAQRCRRRCAATSVERARLSFLHCAASKRRIVCASHRAVCWWTERIRRIAVAGNSVISAGEESWANLGLRV